MFRFRLIIGSALLALALAACGGNGSSTEAAPTTAAPLPPVTIDIKDFSFGEPVTVQIGQEIDVTNLDAVDHTWTEDNGAFDSGNLKTDESFEYSFDEPGEYTFFCTVHPTMTGSITVTG